ncbi:flagellin [Limnohabitans sp.]|uniref:flagellin N-terminal helical domain-containing protein n=1 Tax=Limnohabitans sp. TaxID=1907725 RepID=UPI00391DA786
MTALNTNMAAVVAQTARKNASRLQTDTLTRLSTGLRVNSARDDAAGLAVGARFGSTIGTSSRLIQDLSNGISLAQVAQGGLQQITGLLQRMRELAVQAASGSLAAADRAALDLEFQALNDEIDRISRQTEIFERTPLAPPKPAPTTPPAVIGSTNPINNVLSATSKSFSSGLTSLGYIPQGFKDVTLNINSYGNDDDIQIFTADGKHLLGTPVVGSTDPVWASKGINSAAAANSQIMNTGNAFSAGASYDGSLLPASAGYSMATLPNAVNYNGMSLRHSGDGHPGGQYLEKITIDTVTENLVVMVIGNGAFDASGTWTEPPVVVLPDEPYSEDTTVVMASALGQSVQSLTMTATPADTATLGTANSQISSTAGAMAAMGEIDNAIGIVNGYAVKYGAWTSSFLSTGDNLSEMLQQSSVSRSKIIDADYASESARLAAQKIQQQANDAMLAQANQLPRSVLSLLDKS